MEEMTQRLDDKTDKLESFSKRDNLKFFIVAESTEADIYICMCGWYVGLLQFVPMSARHLRALNPHHHRLPR